jgi:two-component system, NarL family, response regulator NreC
VVNNTKGKIKLFIADDHTLFRKGFIRLITLDDRFEVVGEAENGKEATELVHRLEPDIVLMDIGMPILNGLEATRRIKKDLPHIKVLILSAFDNEKYIHQVVQAGAHGYLLKSVDANTLYSALKSVYKNEYVFPETAQPVLDEDLHSIRNGKINSGSESFHSLTDREREILQLIAEGKSHQQIADILYISIRTVDTHRNNIIKKLDVHDTANLVLYAIKNGITIIPR